MRPAHILAVLILAACPAARADMALYDRLVSDEVPTVDAIRAVPDAAAVAASKIQDEPRYKVGVAVPVDVTVDLGAARPPAGALRLRSDGFTWSAVVEAPGATALRLGFENFDLAPGVALYVYNDLGQVDGPYTGAGRRGRHSFFTRTLPTGRLHLQLRYDGKNNAATLHATHFTLWGVARLDERFLLDRAPATPEPRAHCSNLNATCVQNAECNLQDPLVDPIVDNLRNATGEMLFQSGHSWYLCTGGLIASLDGTTGHFWTAHACISTAAEAASLETYFHFAVPCPPGGGPTTTCDYANATNSDIPTMFGATIIDTSDVTDFTLLKLDGEPPPGTTHLPFSTAPVANTDGVRLHRISYPAGAPQAYSQHQVDANYSLCGAPGNFIYSVDVIGATESGSSGAPVVNAAGEIVGQLHGGCGSNLKDTCDTVNNRTYDGAFAAAWQGSPLVRHALAQDPPETDILSVQDIPSLASGRTWFTVFVNDGSYDNLTFEVTGNNGDANLYVKFGAPPTLSDWDCRPFLPGTNEACTFDSTEVGPYHVMVHAFSPFSNAVLTISTTIAACADADGDGVCDAADTCPLTPNPGGGPAMFSQALIAPDKTTFVWPVPADVLSIQGDLAAVSQYQFSLLSSAAAATAISSGPDPAPGQGTFILVRADCPLGTWSTGAASECPPGTCAAGDRDALLP